MSPRDGSRTNAVGVVGVVSADPGRTPSAGIAASYLRQ